MSASPAQVGKPFTISRRFRAPRAAVFAALTEAQHLAAWMGPAGCTISKCSVDLRVGGTFHYGMELPNGHTMWGKWTYREIVAPERLVVVVQFSDGEGGVTRHPMSPTWPLYTLSTTTLVADGDETVMTLQWQALDASDEESATFDGAHASMQQGWSGTMVQLERHLASVTTRKPEA